MTAARDIAAAEVADDESLLERRLRFLSLRNAGLTFGKIAERWNAQQRTAEEQGGPKAKTVSTTTVRKDVEQAKLAIVGEATREGMIAESYSVILDMRRSVYTAALGGDIDAVKMVLATVRDQRELFGLDQPKRMAIGVGTDVEFAEAVGQLLELVNRADAQKELGQITRSERLDMIEGEVVPDPMLDPNPMRASAARAGGVTSGEPAQPPDADDWANLGD